MAPIRAAVFAGLIGAVGSAVAIALQPILSKLRRRQILLRRLAGRETTHKLKNENGMEAHVIVVGCSIQRLLVPDKQGNLADVVLGCDDIVSYMDGSSPYFGAIVGRCANRISNASCTIKGQICQFAANCGTAALHGGVQGFDKAIWTCDEGVVKGDTGMSVTMTLTSPAGEEGYPGELKVSVTYTLNNSNELTTDMRATTTETTIVNLAQHSYFNLAGHKSGKILDHIIRIYGDHYTPLSLPDLVPTGEIVPVRETPVDFLNPQDIGLRIGHLRGGGYDHNYVLHGMGPMARHVVQAGMASASPKMAASVFDPHSGRCMDVKTTAPAMQFYTGNFLEGTRGKDGVTYQNHAGFCLETQGFPDAVNNPNFPSVLLEPNEEYRHVMVHRFYSP